MCLHLRSGAFIIDFEQVNDGWRIKTKQKLFLEYVELNTNNRHQSILINTGVPSKSFAVILQLLVVCEESHGSWWCPPY